MFNFKHVFLGRGAQHSLRRGAPLADWACSPPCPLSTRPPVLISHGFSWHMRGWKAGARFMTGANHRIFCGEWMAISAVCLSCAFHHSLARSLRSLCEAVLLFSCFSPSLPCLLCFNFDEWLFGSGGFFFRDVMSMACSVECGCGCACGCFSGQMNLVRLDWIVGGVFCCLPLV